MEYYASDPGQSAKTGVVPFLVFCLTGICVPSNHHELSVRRVGAAEFIHGQRAIAGVGHGND